MNSVNVEEVSFVVRPKVNFETAAPPYAALDLGTNNCRLLLAEPTQRGSAPFQVVSSFSRITRLGEGLSDTGALSVPAMNRTLNALHKCSDMIAKHHVKSGRFVTTEACRRAINGDDFLARVKEETGIELEAITAQEEARLALMGCAALLDKAPPYALVFDVGGGSTEVIWARLGEDGLETLEGFVSLPLGVVTVTEDCGGMVNPEDYPKVKKRVTDLLKPFDIAHDIQAHVKADGAQMIGTSGTITTLAATVLDLPRYRRALVDGLRLDFADIMGARDRLVAMSHVERAAHPCIGEGRADLVVAGCAILDAICELWPVGRLRVADRGLREGLLLELMKT